MHSPTDRFQKHPAKTMNPAHTAVCCSLLTTTTVPTRRFPSPPPHPRRSPRRLPLLIFIAKSRPRSPPSHPSPISYRTRARLGDGRSVSKMSSAAAAEESSGEMIFEPILEEGVLRFDCSREHRAAAFPNLSFADQSARETAIESSKTPDYIPLFECVGGKQKVTLKLPPGTSFYGTGEASGQLERTGKRIFTWNTDAWGYSPGTTSLYQSHPWVLALLPDGKALGVLADTTRRCEVDLREKSIIKFVADASYPVITFGLFESPVAVLMSLSRAIAFYLEKDQVLSGHVKALL